MRCRPPLLAAALTALAMFVAWAPRVSAFPNLYDSNCSACHGATQTCAGCHAHGTHSSSQKNDINVTATPDATTYAPGDTISVSITGGYRDGWVRVKLFDENGVLLATASNTCASCPVGVGGVDGISASFPGPIVLTAAAPASAGTYTWQASWYGNEFDASGAAFGNFVPDPNNAGHGDEVVSFQFTVEAPAVEICDNGIDDNGNGLVDCADPQCEGFVDGACDTGEPGICAAGTFVCQNGGQVCVQDQPAGTEGPAGDLTCGDGLDNDCDGLTDAEDGDWAPPAFVAAEVDAPKRINGASRGNTPVEVEFEGLGMVKLESLACGPKNRLIQCLPDGSDCRVNRDDPNEFVALVKTPAMELRCSDQEILCEGMLADGTPFAGADDVDVVRDYRNRRCDHKGKGKDDDHDD